MQGDSYWKPEGLLCLLNAVDLQGSAKGIPISVRERGMEEIVLGLKADAGPQQWNSCGGRRPYEL